MSKTSNFGDTRMSPKTVASIVGLLLAMVLGGCGGPPDMSGTWQGRVSLPDGSGGTMTLDLRQDDEGGLSGTMRTLADGDSPDEISSVPLSGGSVDEDGSFGVTAQVGNALEGTATVEVTGTVDGDRMDARLGIGGPTTAYEATRITEEEYRARLETRRQAYEAEQEAARQAAHEQSVQAARYEEAAKVAGDRAQDVEARLAVLEGGYGEGPEEQLQDALGTEGADACMTGGVGCEVSRLEERLQNDREDVEEAATDDYAPDPCQTVDFSYYEDYSLEEVGASAYLEVRDDLRTAADGLASDADDALDAAREAETARAAYEEAGGSPASPTYSVDDVEAMAGAAEEGERATEQALADAEERYADYEGRVDEVKAEAGALRESAGCAG